MMKPLSLLLAASCLQAIGHAQTVERPAVLKSLEAQGVTVIDEFKVGASLRGFAAAAGDQPVAVYVTADGKAIVGTRLDEKGELMDAATLQKLVAKPMGEQTWAKLQSTKWVLDGKANAPRVVYVFTDANCPYCHRFWEASRPWVDSGKVQLRHILVGVIREDSAAKAAAILTASNPSAAFLESERKQGAIVPAKNVPEKLKAVLEQHQELMVATGFRGTPGIITRDEKGVLKKVNGMPQQGALLDILGPK